MAKKGAGDFPLMHPVQLDALLSYLETELELAFSVENGGRVGRASLRRRIRASKRYMTELLTEKSMSTFFDFDTSEVNPIDLGASEGDGPEDVDEDYEDDETDEEDDDEVTHEAVVIK